MQEALMQQRAGQEPFIAWQKNNKKSRQKSSLTVHKAPFMYTPIHTKPFLGIVFQKVTFPFNPMQLLLNIVLLAFLEWPGITKLYFIVQPACSSRLKKQS